jgi:hypothetical protein
MILYCCCAGAPSSPAAAELVGRLRLLAVLVRYMETSSDMPTAAGSVHPAMRLLQIAYPALEAVAGSAALQADEKVYKALCEVRACTHFLCNAGIINPVAAPLSCLHQHQEDTLDVCMHHDVVLYKTTCAAQVFQRILWADKALAAPLLPGLLSAVTAAVESHHHAACLDTLGIAVAEYGSSAKHAGLIKEAFCRACNAVSALLLVCTSPRVPSSA